MRRRPSRRLRQRRLPPRRQPVRRRLDVELVRRGLASTRDLARELVAADRVRVSGAIADNAARLVDDAESIAIAPLPPRFVSRGGEKLDAALERFRIGVAGCRCLDAGASTGGFTDCLLQRGASEVVAVDVGFGQLHERLRGDGRVRNLERTNLRSLGPTEIGGPVAVAVVDLSFISLRTVLPTLLSLTEVGGALLLLVKPQFEANRQEASKGRGVIKDPSVWRRVLEEVCSAGSERGATMMEAMVSPLTGADGNVEFFVRLQVSSSARADVAMGTSALDLDAVVAEAIALHGV